MPGIMNPMNRIASFAAECRNEFQRINWPTGRETARMTAVVIILSGGIAAFLGAVDFGLLSVLNSYLLGQ